MQDVVAVADRAVVLKAGRKVADRPVAGMAAAELAALIMRGGEAVDAAGLPA
jgi:ABC-type sugar transport system ATPase subunit